MRNWEILMLDKSVHTIQAEKIEATPSGLILFFNLLPGSQLAQPQPAQPQVDLVGVVIAVNIKLIKPSEEFEGKLLKFETKGDKEGSIDIKI